MDGSKSWSPSDVQSGPWLYATFITTSGTCTTPSFATVQLPQVNTAQFNGPGTTASGGVKDFDLTFTNCPPHMHAIHYQMYSTYPEDNAPGNLGLLSLNGSPSAAGVKVQLLRRSPPQSTTYVPVELQQWDKFLLQHSGFLSNPPPPGAITIPFRAQYYQSDPIITPGPVKATVFFQILYQ